MAKLLELGDALTRMAECFDTLWLKNVDLAALRVSLSDAARWSYGPGTPYLRTVDGDHGLQTIVHAENWRQIKVLVLWTGFARMELLLAEPDEFADWEVVQVTVGSGLYRPLARIIAPNHTRTQLVADSLLRIPGQRRPAF